MVSLPSNFVYAKTIELLGDDASGFTERWGGGSDLTDTDVEQLRGIVERSGARAATEALLEGLRDEAMASLAELDIDPQARAALAELARRATERQV